MSDSHDGVPKSISTSLVLLAVLMMLPFLFLLKGQEKGKVAIDGKSYSVVVADTAARQYRGLSGKTPATLGAEGMYFPFPDDAERTFVMRGMLFSLDFLWVRDGKIVKIAENVPAPKEGEQPQLVYSSPEPVDAVVEFPAGFVKAQKIQVGDSVGVR